MQNFGGQRESIITMLFVKVAYCPIWSGVAQLRGRKN